MVTSAETLQRIRNACRGAGTLLGVLLAAAAAGCGTAAGGPGPTGDPEPPPGTQPAAAGGARTVQPGAPGEATRTVEPGAEPVLERAAYTEADVAFMRDMIVHHAQALVMASLAPARTDRREIRLLADRIARSQESEIALMRRWLETRGEAVAADPGAVDRVGHAHGDGHRTMAGMATAEQLARLEAATGDAFDRLFLELMIRHHEGALEMVAALPARGGGQEAEVAMLAGHVDADQRAEIARMRSLQNILLQ